MIRQALSERELLALPPIVDVETAASALGLGRSAAYALVRTGRWPTPVVRLGKRIKIPTAPLLELIGLSGPAPQPAR